MKSLNIGLVGHVERTREKKSAQECEMLLGKLEGKKI